MGAKYRLLKRRSFLISDIHNPGLDVNEKLSWNFISGTFKILSTGIFLMFAYAFFAKEN